MRSTTYTREAWLAARDASTAVTPRSSATCMCMCMCGAVEKARGTPQWSRLQVHRQMLVLAHSLHVRLSVLQEHNHEVLGDACRPSVRPLQPHNAIAQHNTTGG